MDLPQLQVLMDIIHQARTKLMEGKSHDYSGEDTLANFKRMWEISELLDIDPRRSPTDCALFLLVLKIDRWQNLRRKGAQPKNESVLDTVYDLHNYVDLMYACELDISGEDVV